MLTIRQADTHEFDAMWPIIQNVLEAGDTYPYPPDTSREEAYTIWMELPRATYVAEEDDSILGTYYLKPNQPGLGSHVCNAGYMVRAEARGRGIGRAMCLHSQDEAKRLGFLAMQFNLVVSTNPAVKLWSALGYERVGTLPKAFDHKQLGFVDALVMYRVLD